MSIELWQIPLLVMAFVVGVRYAAGHVPRLRGLAPRIKTRLRIASLSVVCAVLAVGLYLSVTPSLNAVAAVTSLLMEGVALHLTWRTLHGERVERAGSERVESPETESEKIG